MQDKLKPKVLKRKIIAESNLFKIEQVLLKFSNGNERTFERMISNRRGAVLIVPMIDNETIILVREYTVGTERYELAFPKGLIEHSETPIEAANRELKEEIGFGSRDIRIITEMTAAPGYWGGRTIILFAENLYPAKLEGDEPEPLDVVYWKLKDYKALLTEETFSESRSIAALLLLKDQING